MPMKPTMLFGFTSFWGNEEIDAACTEHALPDRALAAARGFPLALAAGLVAFLLIHFALRLLHSPGLNVDDGDLILCNQWLAWGYGEQPPLYSWLYRPVSMLFGDGLLALGVLRIAVLTATALLLYGSALEATGDRRLATFGTVAIVLTPVVAWHSLTYLTHSILMAACIAGVLYCVIRIVKHRQWSDYLALGAAVGLGALSKYNFVFFVLAIASAGLTLPAARRAIFDARIVAALVLAAVIVLPHARWAREHLPEIAAAYQQKADDTSPQLWGVVPHGALDAAVNFLLLAAPFAGICLFAAPALIRGPRAEAPAASAQVVATLLERTFLFLVAWHVLYAIIADASRIRERWVEPFFVLAPVLLACRLQLRVIPSLQIRRLAWCIVFLAAGLTTASFFRSCIGRLDDGYNTIDSRFSEAADALRPSLPHGALVFTDDRGVAGNLCVLFPDCLFLCAHRPLYVPRQKPCVSSCTLAWIDNDGEEPPEVLREFAVRFGFNVADDSTPASIDLPVARRNDHTRRLAYMIASCSPNRTESDRIAQPAAQPTRR